MRLPSDWIEALAAVADASRRTDVPYAVVGSLGIAASQGLDFQALRPPVGRSTEGSPRDLDVFLAGPDAARRRFQALLAAVWPRSRPIIDLVPIYHEQIRFQAGGVILRYREIAVPVEPRLFRIFEVQAAGLQVPVLHPRTHLHMMGHNPLFQKTRWNIRCLTRRPRGVPAFPPLPEIAFDAFHSFKRAKRRQYPLRYAALGLREALYARELAGEGGLLLKAKSLLRERYPRAAEFARHCLG